VWFGFIAAFVALHYVDRDALRETGVRVSTPKVIAIAWVQLLIAVALTGVLPGTSPHAEMAVLAVMTLAGFHGEVQRIRSPRALPYAALADALSAPGDVESRRRAIVKLIDDDRALKLDLDSIAERHRTGSLPADLSELLSTGFDRAIENGASTKQVRVRSARANAGVRQLLTGEAYDPSLVGGSLGSLHDDAIREAQAEKHGVLNYQFVDAADPVEAVREAEYSAARLFKTSDAAVGLVFVVENEDARQAIRHALGNRGLAIEVVLRRPDMPFSAVREEALRNPAIARMEPGAQFRLLMPSDVQLPEGFFDLSAQDMARYRIFVLILLTLNAVVVEIRATDLGRMNQIEAVVERQA
jgi:hypothetical protein